MGLGLQAVDAIGREHAYCPIKGDVLFIGRQATYFTPAGLAAQLRSYGHVVDPSAIEIDRTTVHRLPGYGEIVTDRSIFHALGIDSVKALDTSPYEGAEIVHDLNRPLPDNLKATADFIVDGSTLDNVFDPAMTLRNYAQLLRPGGRLLASTHSTPATVRLRFARRIGSSTISSKTDFPIAKFMSAPDLPAPTTAIGSIRNTWPAKGRVNWCFPPCGGAITPWSLPKRVPHPLRNASPTQHPYRSAEEWTRYVARLSAINRSPRPHLARSVGMLLPRLARRGFKLDGQDIQAAVAKTVPAASDPARLDASALPGKSLTRPCRWRSPRARRTEFIAT